MIEQRALWEQAFGGHAEAIAFVELLADISQTWDDLVDADADVPRERVDAAFFDALVVLPRNPFYREHFDALSPLVEMAALDWMTATDFEREPAGDVARRQHLLTLSMGLRDNLAAVAVKCVSLLRGPLAARHWSTVIREAVMAEPLAEYLAEFSE